MAQNKIVLFDIDYTIFNAKNYRDVFQEALYKELGQGFSKEDFIKVADETYTETKNQTGHFDPELLIETLAKKINKTLDIKRLTNLVINDSFVQSSIYEESVEVFTELSKDPSLTLGIFSAGRIELQRAKIIAIEEFLHKEHVHIFEYKKLHALPELLNRYKDDRLYIVDDILSILSEAKKIYNSVTTIWIRRGMYKDTQADNFEPDFTIENLREMIDILKK